MGWDRIPRMSRSHPRRHVGTLSIVVADGWRDVGIGSALVRTAQQWAREQGLLKVALAVFPDNSRAIAVYEHAGFVREGLRRRQYRALFDAGTCPHLTTIQLRGPAEAEAFLRAATPP